ncbi:MAG: AAA family ATPase [Fimbriimonadaceae bacterium]|nr:AAA family ATPase [Fimbriimonadaceae bacterium]
MKTFAVASGKGGTGKTMLSANLAASLALDGRPVTVLDADLGLANADIAMGLNPEVTLKHVVRGQAELKDTLIEGPAGLRLIPGGSSVAELAGMGTDQIIGLIDRVKQLCRPDEWLIIDAAAGIHDTVMAFLTSADEVCLICTPDPSSLIDAYATAKQLGRLRPTLPIAVIVNQTDSQRHGVLVFERLKLICGQFLSTDLRYAGAVRRDDGVVAATRMRRLILLEDPSNPAAQDIEDAAGMLFHHRLPDRRDDNLIDKFKAAFKKTA